MERLGTGYGEPIRSLQSFLRKISEHYPIPPVVPDGVFGMQTRVSVQEFQRYFGLESTGEVDSATWDQVLSKYDSIVEKTREPNSLKLFPSTDTIFVQGVQSEHLFAIQGILLAITRHFPSLGSLSVTGVFDTENLLVVQRLQAIFGLPISGELDILTWEYTQRLYQSFVTSHEVATLTNNQQLSVRF